MIIGGRPLLCIGNNGCVSFSLIVHTCKTKFFGAHLFHSEMSSRDTNELRMVFIDSLSSNMIRLEVVCVYQQHYFCVR